MPQSQARWLRKRSRYGLSRQRLFAGKIMIRALGWLCAAVTLLVAGQAQAQFFDMRDIMGGGPNFRGGPNYGGGYSGGYGGYSGGSGSPIQRGMVMLGGYSP